jgi:hypothetical protein
MSAAGAGEDPMASRVFAQTYDPNSELETLGDAVVVLTRCADSLSLDEFTSKVESLQYRIASVTLADRAAAASAEVALVDSEELGAMVTEFQRLSAEAREDVSTLRARLNEERRACERRVQYNALAKVIRKEQTREISERLIAAERAAIEKLEAQTVDIEKKKTRAKMEFQLLLQCVADLEVYAFTDALTPSEALEAPERSRTGTVQPGGTRPDGTGEDVEMIDAPAKV